MCFKYFLGICILSFPFALFSQKKLAITIDDPHTKTAPLFTWEERNHMILETLKQYQIQTALFVCGMRLDDVNGPVLLAQWDQMGHLICNHTYSHYYYPSTTLASFLQDFKKGDRIIKSYKNYTKLFRFPYLKEGDTKEKRDGMRAFIDQYGYKNGHVTIDASDWYIDAQLIQAIEQNPGTNLTPYRQYYIQHILDRAEYYDSLAKVVFKRNIPHTLLIHHSLLNALFLEDLIIALKENGWEIIDASDAYKDKVFSLQPDILPAGESIVWQYASLDPDIRPYLRYPAEDGKYEQDGLEKTIKDFRE